MASLRTALAVAGIGLVIGPFVSAQYGILFGTLAVAVPFYVGVALLPVSR